MPPEQALKRLCRFAEDWYNQSTRLDGFLARSGEPRTVKRPATLPYRHAHFQPYQ